MPLVHSLKPKGVTAKLRRHCHWCTVLIKKYHQYLYGRKFLLVTDHKPLLTILGPKKQLPTLAAARLQRWVVLLSAYQYDIEFRSTDKHCNADGFS